MQSINYIQSNDANTDTHLEFVQIKYFSKQN